MPYARKSTRRYSRYSRRSSSRTFYKRKPRRSYRSTRSKRTNWKNPLPGTGSFKFRYTDSGYSLSVATPTFTNSYVFRGNSLFDPDVSGVGVQPYGYDNYCGANAPFGKYCVYGSKIKIYPHINSTEANCRAVHWIVVPTRSNPPSYTEFEDLKQVPGARSLVVNSIDDQRGHLSAYMSTKRIFGEVGSLANDFSAIYSNNPASPWYWYLQSDSLASGKDVTQTFDVQITYYARLAKSDDINES